MNFQKWELFLAHPVMLLVLNETSTFKMNAVVNRHCYFYVTTTQSFMCSKYTYALEILLILTDI